MNRRILWIDFSKGLAMLMVIAGHSLGGGGLSGLLHGAIFSFHMPLFFLLSGLLCLDSPSSERWVKVVGLARKLLTPCIIIISIRWSWGWFCNGINPNGPLSEIVDKSLSVLMASGVPVRFFDKAIDPIGSCWFLVVLFGARILYGFIPGTRIIRGVVCICLALLGYLISQQAAVPFDADLIMIAVLFLYIGQTLKWVANRFDGRINSLKLLMYSGVLWMCLLACVFFVGRECFNMAARRFPLYPLSILCAVAGSVMICALSKILCEKPHNTFVSCIAYLGRWSLYLFAVHSVDAVWLAFWHSAGWCEVLLRVACDVAVFYGVMVWFDPKIRNAMFSRMHV